MEAQLERLMRYRGLSETDARTRMDAQPSQLEKLARADVVIDTAGTMAETRAQVVKALQKILQSAKEDADERREDEERKKEKLPQGAEQQALEPPAMSAPPDAGLRSGTPEAVPAAPDGAIKRAGS